MVHALCQSTQQKEQGVFLLECPTLSHPLVGKKEEKEVCPL